MGDRPASEPGGSGLVLAATAVGGVVAVAVWLAWSYSYHLGHRGMGQRSHLAPLPYWSQYLLIALVAFVGARLAPTRVRAVVVAACAAQVLLVVITKGQHLLEPNRLGVDLWRGEILLVVSAWAGARLGCALARRSSAS
jgi:hypothetical protein